MLLADEVFYRDIESYSLLDITPEHSIISKGRELRTFYETCRGLNENELDALIQSDNLWYEFFKANCEALMKSRILKLSFTNAEVRDSILESLDKQSDYEVGLRNIEEFKAVTSRLDKTLNDRILNSVIFQCGNVEKLYSASIDAGKEFGVKDVVSLLPPFESIFVEFSTPDKGYTSTRAGVLMECIPREESKVTHDPELSQFGLAEVFDRSKYIVRATTIMQMADGKIIGPLAVTEYGVGELGEVMVPESVTTDQFSWGVSLPLDNRSSLSHEVLFELIAGYDSYFKMVAMLGISFSHLKNVVTKDRDPEASNGRAGRKEARTKGAPLEKYKVLDIPGIKDITEGIIAANAEGRTSDLALFFSRAHTKTYTAERPLFGKHVGTWAWSPRWIGDLQNGTIDKSYRVAINPVLEL